MIFSLLYQFSQRWYATWCHRIPPLNSLPGLKHYDSKTLDYMRSLNFRTWRGPQIIPSISPVFRRGRRKQEKRMTTQPRISCVLWALGPAKERKQRFPKVIRAHLRRDKETVAALSLHQPHRGRVRCSSEGTSQFPDRAHSWGKMTVIRSMPNCQRPTLNDKDFCHKTQPFSICKMENWVK